MDGKNSTHCTNTGAHYSKVKKKFLKKVASLSDVIRWFMGRQKASSFTLRVQPSWFYSNEPGCEGGDGEEWEAEHQESPKTKPSTWPTTTELAATSSGLDLNDCTKQTTFQPLGTLLKWYKCYKALKMCWAKSTHDANVRTEPPVVTSVVKVWWRLESDVQSWTIINIVLELFLRMRCKSFSGCKHVSQP